MVFWNYTRSIAYLNNSRFISSVSYLFRKNYKCVPNNVLIFDFSYLRLCHSIFLQNSEQEKKVFVKNKKKSEPFTIYFEQVIMADTLNGKITQSIRLLGHLRVNLNLKQLTKKNNVPILLNHNQIHKNDESKFLILLLQESLFLS